MKDDYRFVVNKDNEDMACVCITNGGEFDGVIYKYGAVTIPSGFNEEGNLPFKFEFDIIDNYGLQKEQFDENFFTLIGDILVHIINTQTSEDIDDEEEEDTI